MRPISGSSSPARARAVRSVAYAASGSRGGRGAALAAASLGVGAGVTRVAAAGRRRRHLGLAVRDVLEDVEPGDALRGEQLRRVRPVLLERRRDDVAGMHFLAAGALDVQHRRLQHAPERQRLLGLLLLAARELLDAIPAGTCRDRGAAAAGRRRRPRGSARRPGRAPARRAGARASGAYGAARSPRGRRRSGRFQELD